MGVRRGMRAFAGRERLLWMAAILLYGVGDLATTLFGLSSGSVAEIGPVAGPVMEEFGRIAFPIIKVATLAFCYGVWVSLRSPGRAAVPAALIVVGSAVTAWNSVVILAAGLP